MTVGTLNVTGINVDFRKLADQLRRLKPVTFEEALEGIRGVTAVLEIRRVMRALKLDKDPSLTTLACLWSKDEYVSTAISLLAAKIPIWEDAMGDLELYPEPLGMNRFSGDDIYECFSMPDSYFSEGDGVEVLMAALDKVIDDDEWAVCNEFFGWDMPEPPDIPNGGIFHPRSMNQRLRIAGMVPFIGAMDVAIGIDNIFFTYDCCNSVDAIEFTTANVRWLMRELEKAELRIKDLQAAEEMAIADPSLFRTYTDIWKASFKLPVRRLIERDMA